ncbi:hypothetical protein [Sinimarinibacterium flocculans]|uniref:hypothetical protein n=1 Tax=Sinimarinibacterium flocculans TaxID=985250 RepID=UPI00351251EB
MSTEHTKRKIELLRLTDELVEDILSMSDEELRKEAKEIDLSAEADRLRALIEQAELRARKDKLRQAQQQVRSEKEQRSRESSATNVDVARRIMGKLRDSSNESVRNGLMLAARKANKPIDQLSESDVLGLAEDLKELDLWDGDENE